jgi:hypothetical protein
MMSLASVQTFTCNPVLKEETDVVGYLQDFEENAAHPFGEFMISIIDSQIHRELKPGDPAFYLSSQDAASIERIVSESLPNSIHPILAEYQLNVLLPGSIIKTSISQFSIIAVTRKVGQYFDLVAYQVDESDQLQTLTFHSSTNVCNHLRHSGDHVHNNYLTHTISVTPYEGVFVVGVTGYSRTPLKQFVNQNPIILVVDHNTHIINAIPLSLDEATVGLTASHANLLRCTVLPNQILQTEVITPSMLVNLNTGDLTNEVETSIRQILDAPQIVEPAVSTVFAVASTAKHDNSTIASMVSLADFTVPAIIEFSDTNSSYFTPGLHVPFYSGIGDTCVSAESTNKVKLPVLFGIFRNHPIVLLGERYNCVIPSTMYYDIVNSTHVIVHVTTKNWNNIGAETCTKNGNCIFVLHVTDEELVVIDIVKVYFITMVGPRSLVVYENGGVYYYYRGITLPGFPRQDYGTIVEDFQEKLQTWLSTPLMCPVISARNDTTAWMGGSPCSFQTFLKISDEDIIKIIEERVSELLDVIIQFTIVCNTEQIADITNKLIGILTFMQTTEKAAMMEDINQKKKLLQDAVGAADLSEIVELARDYREFNKKFDTKYSELLKFIHSMISQKNVVSRVHTLERAAKKLTIAKNVATVSAMSRSEIVDLISSGCEEHGAVIADVNVDAVRHVLQNVSDFDKSKEGTYGDSNEFAALNSTTNCFQKNVRCPSLDSITYQTIVDVTVDKPRGLQSEKTLTLPPVTGSYTSDTCIALPLFGILANIVLPNKDWKTLADVQEISSWRIAMRGTFVNAYESRDIQLSESSTSLGASLCLMILELLETLVQDRQTPPEEGDTMLYVIRGLLGLLITTMASGTNSQLKVWELFDSDSTFAVPASKDGLKIYQRTMRIALMARWVTERVATKYQKICCACSMRC